MAHNFRLLRVCFIETIKKLGILRYRGSSGGCKINVEPRVIPVVISQRCRVFTPTLAEEGINCSVIQENLIVLKLVTRSGDIQVGFLNAQSINNKTAVLHDLVASKNLDILVIAETFHETSESLLLRHSIPPGYGTIDAPRPIPEESSPDFATNHRGLAFIFSDNIRVTKKNLKVSATTFEYLCGYATINNQHVIILGIYRPNTKTITSEFFKEFTAIMDIICTYRCPILVCGYFNVHVDVQDDSNGKKLKHILQTSECMQHIHELTHNRGHTLDLVITRDDVIITNIAVGGFISNHAPITFTFPLGKPPFRWATKEVRCWKRFDEDAFLADLQRSPLVNIPSDIGTVSLEDMATMYDNTLKALFDKHCPVRSILMKKGMMTPWFDGDCRAKRRYTRMLERRYRRTKDDVDREAWFTSMREMHKLYKQKEKHYWHDKVNEGKGCSRSYGSLYMNW